jgi:hypothetical protein
MKYYILLFFILLSGVSFTQTLNLNTPSQNGLDTFLINPVPLKSGGMCEYDGKKGFYSSDSLVLWIDQINGDTMYWTYTFGMAKPSIKGDGFYNRFFNYDAAGLKCTNAYVYDGNWSFTVATTYLDPYDTDDILGYDSIETFEVLRRVKNSDNLLFFDEIYDLETSNTHVLKAEILQISCENEQCAVYLDGEYVNTFTVLAGPSTKINMIGKRTTNLINVGFNGYIHYISMHDSPYTEQEQKQIFNYVNQRFNMGL